MERDEEASRGQRVGIENPNYVTFDAAFSDSVASSVYLQPGWGVAARGP
jgi:hypothetical protein